MLSIICIETGKQKLLDARVFIQLWIFCSRLAGIMDEFVYLFQSLSSVQRNQAICSQIQGPIGVKLMKLGHVIVFSTVVFVAVEWVIKSTFAVN